MFTGALEIYSRSEAKSLTEKNGGESTRCSHKKIRFLVVGTQANKKKK